MTENWSDFFNTVLAQISKQKIKNITEKVQ